MNEWELQRLEGERELAAEFDALRAENEALRETAAEMSRWLSRWRHAIKIHADGATQAWDELERLHNLLAKEAK